MRSAVMERRSPFANVGARADEKLSAFLELERITRNDALVELEGF
jgi:hypothetical protein